MDDSIFVQEQAKRNIKKNRKLVGNPRILKPRSCLTKYVDVLNNTYNISSTAIFTLLNGISAGTDFYNRINRVVNGQELKLTLTFTTTPSGAGNYATPDVARIIVFWDHQGIATPVASDILLSVNNAGTTNTSNICHRNINNKERFIFLVDCLYALPAYSYLGASTTTGVTSGHTVNSKNWSKTFNIDLNNLITRYNGTSSGITNITNGALYFFVLGSVLNTSSDWSVTMTSSFVYVDV